MSSSPSMLSADGVAKLLGISRQRVDQIVKADEGFPTPTLVGERIRAWQQADIVAWGRAARRLCGVDDCTRRATAEQVRAGQLVGVCDQHVLYDVPPSMVPHEPVPGTKSPEIPRDL